MSERRRVTMTEKRTQAIYGAVHGPIMDARVAITRILRDQPAIEDRVDEILFAAQSRAAAEAVRAAGGQP